MRLLIDPDLLTDIERDERIERQFGTLARICARNGVELYLLPVPGVPPAGAGSGRRGATAQRGGGPVPLPGGHAPSKADLEREFGPCPTDERLVDATLLDAVRTKVADYVVSNDGVLHRFAELPRLDALVFTVEDALAWALRTYEPQDVPLPTVLEVGAAELDFDDPIFDELREDYTPGFDAWTGKISREGRRCWIVRVDGRLASLVIRKDESHAEAKTHHPGPNILKISTIKVAEHFRGRKLGEQMVKQILWFAQRNGFDLVYLTAFPKQKPLRLLLEAYGFAVTRTMRNGEMVFEKEIVNGPLVRRGGETALAASCRGYPNFVCDAGVRKFVIPIRPAYHAMLFPESGWTAADADVEILGRPGNTIEKVYLCHSRITTMRPGDVIHFYLSKGTSARGSQSITTVGVVKSVRWSRDIDQVRLWTAKRSVYPDDELIEMSGRSTPLMIIDFLLVGHLAQAAPLGRLTTGGVLSGPPQSIVRIDDHAFGALKRMIDLGFAF